MEAPEHVCSIDCGCDPMLEALDQLAFECLSIEGLRYGVGHFSEAESHSLSECFTLDQLNDMNDRNLIACACCGGEIGTLARWVAKLSVQAVEGIN